MSGLRLPNAHGPPGVALRGPIVVGLCVLNRAAAPSGPGIRRAAQSLYTARVIRRARGHEWVTSHPSRRPLVGLHRLAHLRAGALAVVADHDGLRVEHSFEMHRALPELVHVA